MPYDVKEERRADTLMRGTRVILENRPETVLYVQSVDVKVKYTYVSFGTSPGSETLYDRLKYENGDKIITVREKLTDEETFNRDYQRGQHWAETILIDSLATTPADRLRLMADDWDRNKQHGDVFDWSTGSTFLKRQAEYKVWMTVKRTYERLVELYGSDITPLSAVVVELHNRRKETEFSVPNDPTSRSTNVLSNLIGDIDTWAWDVLNDMSRYRIGIEIYEHELARVQQLAHTRKVESQR